MSRSFLEHLAANNSAGLEAVWSRANDAERDRIVAELLAEPGTSEAHCFFKALVEHDAGSIDRRRSVRVGIEAVSDLASRGSSDRLARLGRWAGEPAVREALLATAAQRGAGASSELVEWLGSTEDDAFTDALIPIFLAAVEQRAGGRLQQLAELAQRNPRLGSIAARFEQLKADSRAEWRSFVEALGLPGDSVFAASSQFRSKAPTISLVIDPRRLNWYSLAWGGLEIDSARRTTPGFAFDADVPLVELPPRIHRRMRELGLKGRSALHTSGGEAVRARLASWLAR